MSLPETFSINELRALYFSGKISPVEVIAEIRQRIDRDRENPVWITVLDEQTLLPYLNNLESLDKNKFPLWGIPFAIKDNIDLENIPTTAACPAFAYTPTRNATVVQKLLDAAAIPIGKTNMDQFATGLVGTRSPYGEVQNAFVADYISGGSSSGSAVAVARGHVAFALGTDTAGSGRVPASLNNLIGLKPSRGLLSTSGVVPACKTLDCVSLFAHTLGDAELLLNITQGVDANDCYSRALELNTHTLNKLTVGIPKKQQLEFFGDFEAEKLFHQSIEAIQKQNTSIIEIDLAPFIEAAQMLYGGPWVAERWLTAKDVLETNSDAILPVIKNILLSANSLSAAESFHNFYRIAELRKIIEPTLALVDVILTPTIARPWLRDEVRKNPLELNSKLGYYTNFMNLFDLAALAVPQGFFSNGLPNGVTLFADHSSDLQLLKIAAHLFPDCAGENPMSGENPMQDKIEYHDLLVCGAHMSGLPLNTQLTERGAVFGESVKTAACYQLYALPGGPPFRPGLVRVVENGVEIEAEIWRLPASRWGDFIALIPAPLGIGSVMLADGRLVKGFLCEGFAINDATNISELGSWRNFLKII